MKTTFATIAIAAATMAVSSGPTYALTQQEQKAAVIGHNALQQCIYAGEFGESDLSPAGIQTLHGYWDIVDGISDEIIVAGEDAVLGAIDAHGMQAHCAGVKRLAPSNFN